jgi:hypothetical protein
MVDLTKDMGKSQIKKEEAYHRSFAEPAKHATEYTLLHPLKECTTSPLHNGMHQKNQHGKQIERKGTLQANTCSPQQTTQLSTTTSTTIHKHTKKAVENQHQPNNQPNSRPNKLTSTQMVNQPPTSTTSTTLLVSRHHNSGEKKILSLSFHCQPFPEFWLHTHTHTLKSEGINPKGGRRRHTGGEEQNMHKQV